MTCAHIFASTLLHNIHLHFADQDIPRMHLSHLLRGVATTFPPSTAPLSSDITPLQGSKHKASWMLERFFTEPRGHGLREVFRSPVRAPRWTLNKKSHGFCLSSTTMMTLGPPKAFSIRTRIQAGGVNSHTPASAILCAP